jgi:GT2 family glycosyltransferase
VNGDGAVLLQDARRPAAPAAPPVIAVVVVHDPGPWFDQTLESLARQDYPAFGTLFFLTGDDIEETAARIGAVLPDAFIEPLGDNPGFGAAANSVLQYVEGDNGFFCICHDDVALDHDAVRAMVEELYRSNAGIVGPKLVSWDNPRVLQNVGLDVDRFGQPASRVDLGEVDQEQHDAVTDVFAVPSACFLVRADLFRALGGFDATMSYHGEDVDLCWRAHISGARVLVAPEARVRHREQLDTRRPDLNHPALRARHRMRSALTLTAGSRLPVRTLELVALTLVELVAGLFTGHLRDAWASLRALVGSIPRFPTLLARRGTIAKLRRVSDADVHDLQSHGSNQLSSFRRAHESQLVIGVEQNLRRWRERSLVPTITWLAVIIGVLAASRSFINGSVPTIGEFLPFPDSPGQLWSDFVSGWNGRELGSTSPNPTGFAVLAVGSVLWLFNMSLGLTVTVVGSVLLGGLGVWRLADLFPSNRERVVALVTYVAMPLLPGVISTGRLTALVAFAALPWFVHFVRSAAGIGTADPKAAAADLADGVIALGARERARRIAVTGVVAAIAVALAPPVLLLLAGVTIVLALSSLLVGAGWRTSAWMFAAGVAAAAIAWALNLPAASTWTWDQLTAIPLAGAPGSGVIDVASMNIGRARLGLLALALYVPVFIGLVLSRAWRLTWAGRAAGLVVTFGVLAVLQDRDALPFRVPETGVLLAPVALGLAIAAACAVASFVADVARGDFGWRQPLGVLSIAAVLCGVFPALVTLTDGAWFAPRTTMMTLLAPRLDDEEFGDFRVLYLGDPRVLPAAPHDLGGGIAYTLTGSGVPQIAERWAAPGSDADDEFARTLTDVASGATQRGGRLFAPYAIRYIVVPRYDGAQSTPSDPIEPPVGLTDALGAQLDLRHLFTSPSIDVFENTAAFPGTAAFTGSLADATAADTPAELVRRDLSGAEPVLSGALEDRTATGEVPAGVVSLAVPLDERWGLNVAGEEVPAQASFGSLTAFDVSGGGAQLGYDTSTSRRVEVAAQALLWVAALVAASRAKVPRWALRRPGRGRRRPVIDLAEHVELPSEDGEVPLLESGPRPPDTVSLEPVGARAGRPAAGRAARPLFRADDEASRAAWVEEMFGDEDPDVGSTRGPGLGGAQELR